MAFWQRKRGKQVVVFVWHEGKQQALPRSETRHLDAEPDHNIDTWVTQWERTHEGRPSDRPDPLAGTDLAGHLAAYVAYLRSRGKAYSTVAWHHGMLRDHVLPFFLGQAARAGDETDLPPDLPLAAFETHVGLQDPATWPGRSIQLLTWLQLRGLGEANIVKANGALRGFWEWLCDERIVPGNAPELRLRRPVITTQPTPLKYTATPDQVLLWAASLRAAERDLWMLGLLGYFFSLRPQETLALRPTDFRAGKIAADLESAAAMRRAELYDRFAVHVGKQREITGKTVGPKSHSKGWISCFDERAARALVTYLSGLPREAPLFPQHSRTYYKRWSQRGYPQLALKDMRRASLYWLGHHSKMRESATEVQKHARHKHAQTTALYLRRPEEIAPAGALDLDS